MPQAVEAHQGEVLRDGPARPGQLGGGADGNGVRGAEGRRTALQLQDAPDGPRPPSTLLGA